MQGRDLAHGNLRRISGDDVTHDELLHTISADFAHNKAIQALYEVVELHKPTYDFETGYCLNCAYVGGELMSYPCPTIQAIEEELK
jgi:hypothetical protein